MSWPLGGVGGHGQDKFPALLAQADARRVQVVPELAVGGDDVRLHHGRQDVDQAGAADALGLHHVDGDNHGLVSLGIEAHFLDGAGGGPHAELDAAALEGRSGGAGGAGQPLLVADDDLAVGADIDEQRQLGVFVDPRGQDPGHNIAPDVTGHGTHRIDEHVVRHFQAQVPGPDRREVAGGGGVGGQADILGVDAVEQMGHGGVGGHRDVGDLRHRQLVLFEDPVHHLVDGGGHRALQLLQPLVFLAEDHAGDDVVPVTHLGVVIRPGADDLAGGQVQDLDPDGGGADVNGDGIVARDWYRRARPALPGASGTAAGQSPGWR